VQFPQRRSRTLEYVSRFPGLANAIREWQVQEWKHPGCPPSPIPAVLEFCNFLVLKRDGGDVLVHASEDFYEHPWHDAVLDTSGFMCRCIAALLFPLPRDCEVGLCANYLWRKLYFRCDPFHSPIKPAYVHRPSPTYSFRQQQFALCQDEHLLSSACDLGPRKGWHIPLLFCRCMAPFWPFAKQETHHEIPQHLRGATMPAYASAGMQACGRFLWRHTKVKAWVDRRPAPEVIQWDHVQNKVHLEQGFAQAMDDEPTFWWDFDCGFW